MAKFSDRLSHAWNAFRNSSPNPTSWATQMTMMPYENPGRRPLKPSSNRSILGMIFTRISVDASQIEIRNVYVDENNCYLGNVDSNLNYCLTKEANIDQTARAFRQDAIQTLFEEGVIAIVPTECEEVNIETGTLFNIRSLRVGTVVAWYPKHVKVDLYDDNTGRHRQIILPKKYVAIIQNPFYGIMNEPNSTLKRLRRKQALLDSADEYASSNKLDLIIQLPYSLKGDLRNEQAEKRRQTIETQLQSSKYGIAYIDSTEHITQLNRAVESNLDKQVEYLTTQLYNQLGLTQGVFDGTADEKTMLNYQNNTLEPIIAAITEGMEVKFLSKTARTKGQALKFFKEPFRLVPVSQLADISDKFSRNEILTPNELRAIVGFIPSDDPAADQLRNRNISQAPGDMGYDEVPPEEMPPEEAQAEYEER